MVVATYMRCVIILPQEAMRVFSGHTHAEDMIWIRMKRSALHAHKLEFRNNHMGSQRNHEVDSVNSHHSLKKMAVYRACTRKED